jgi:hypothetical protein
MNPFTLAPLVLPLVLAGPVSGRTIEVGPDRPIRSPAQAARLARDGDVVKFDAARYPGGTAVWRANDLVLSAVGGRAHMQAAGESAQGKAIWVIQGDNTTVEGIEFSGCRVPGHNGAGIRLEASGLTVRDARFHHNEMGILTGNDWPDSEILIERSEFAHNTTDYQRFKRLGHNIYVGANTRRFTLRYSYVHGARVGHNVKSRARANLILYNRIGDETDGAASYLVDLPDGGDAFVIGNSLHQGRRSSNQSAIAYAAEANGREKDGQVYFVNNTVVSDRPRSLFFNNHGASKAHLINNLVVGSGALVKGPAEMRANRFGSRDRDFVNAAAFDYRLTAAAAAIDGGVDPGLLGGFDLRPRFHYRHPLRFEPRPMDTQVDVGAYEYTPAPGDRHGHRASGRRVAPSRSSAP